MASGSNESMGCLWVVVIFLFLTIVSLSDKVDKLEKAVSHPPATQP